MIALLAWYNAFGGRLLNKDIIMQSAKRTNLGLKQSAIFVQSKMVQRIQIL